MNKELNSKTAERGNSCSALVIYVYRLRISALQVHMSDIVYKVNGASILTMENFFLEVLNRKPLTNKL